MLLFGLLALTATASGAADLRGFASLGLNGLILFQPCDGKVVDPHAQGRRRHAGHGALSAGIDDVRKIMLESGRPLYVEFRGESAGHRCQGDGSSSARSAPLPPAKVRPRHRGGDAPLGRRR